MSETTTSYAETKRANRELNRAEARDGKTVLESLPVSVYIDVNLKCNIDCPSCFRSDPKLAADFAWPTMEWELFERLAQELLPTAYRVILSGGGESLMHKQFERILELTCHYQARPLLYTNGTPLTQAWVERLIDAGVVMGVSIDGATAAMFEKLRYPAKWDRVLRNLQRVKEARATRDNPDFFPVLSTYSAVANRPGLRGFLTL